MSVVGDYYVNGMLVDLMDSTTRISFVAQYSVEVGELTPRETIRNRVLLRNPDANERAVDEMVEVLIDNFSLQTCADTKTKLTSG